MFRYEGTSTSSGGGAPVQIYLDNVLMTTLANPTNAVVFSNGQLTNWVIGTNTNFYIDDLKVYNQVFTEAEQCTIVIGGTWGGSSCTLP